MLTIVALSAEPVATLTAIEAQRDHQPTPCLIPVLRGEVSGLPAGLDGLVLTSDLQSRMPDPAWPGTLPVLSGVGVAAALARHGSIGRLGLVPPLERCGVVLAGDLFAAPGADERGATGPVDEVWAAFEREALWVVGVRGNHDRLQSDRRGAVLDGQMVERSGLRIAGLSGIIGKATRENRRGAQDYLERLAGILSMQADLTVIHPSPRVPGGLGDAEVAAVIDQGPPTLVAAGHSRWNRPTATLANGTQCLNLDGRVVVLTPPAV